MKVYLLANTADYIYFNINVSIKCGPSVFILPGYIWMDGWIHWMTKNHACLLGKQSYERPALPVDL